uniref:C-type lectin domain-containing protein n=1 Tax=Astatotilapia calliptera TaxID=8154 RepID=A0A3P8QSN0_ASTCA
MLRKIELERETVKIHVTGKKMRLLHCNCGLSILFMTSGIQSHNTTFLLNFYFTFPTFIFYSVFLFVLFLFYFFSEKLAEIKPYEPCYKCEDDWKEHGGNCYYFSTNSSSWNESRTVCKTKGGDLVKIDSEEEQNFLRKNVQQKMEIHDIPFWIGLTDLAEEGRWLWCDRSTPLTFWRFFEPDDWKGKDPDGEDCGRMGPLYWYDNSCKRSHRSICEKSISPCFNTPESND